ncbi:LLM class F420-dependent oxidoreductase [Xylanimonas oleitrophica]|uniref:LLM class F420-dependent oxidoreductase n=1 Tax=Xylanimonas oleitrophica TaxID=2607479 RepID=A0A2W5YDM8_9MICO|nr:LLM class F420-dependent oxidoreductase [Xylanimonas oleitrophica]PZR52381.1 LLM class F420-dependent oxidoreductase [Xylanimonas oleitrophica]
MTLDLRIFTEPQQGATYDDQLRAAKAAEALGFGAFFRSDHYLAMGGEGLPGPTDAWTTLAGLARETSTIRLGTLVSAATFRHPGVLAIQVAQVDQMSGGRVELGLGAGWFEAEHRAYGIPFPARRFGLLEEQLEILTGLWGTPVGETFSFSGTHYTLVDSPALPKPVQPHVPLVMGGQGRPRSVALAARFADEFNQDFPDPSTIATRVRSVDDGVRATGRERGRLVHSVVLPAVVGATEADAARRAARTGQDLTDVRRLGIGGTVTEAVDRLHEIAAAGVSRVYLQMLDIHDLDHLDLVARDVRDRL